MKGKSSASANFREGSVYAIRRCSGLAKGNNPFSCQAFSSRSRFGLEMRQTADARSGQCALSGQAAALDFRPCPTPSPACALRVWRAVPNPFSLVAGRAANAAPVAA